MQSTVLYECECRTVHTNTGCLNISNHLACDVLMFTFHSFTRSFSNLRAQCGHKWFDSSIQLRNGTVLMYRTVLESAVLLKVKRIND